MAITRDVSSRSQASTSRSAVSFRCLLDLRDAGLYMSLCVLQMVALLPQILISWDIYGFSCHSSRCQWFFYPCSQFQKPTTSRHVLGCFMFWGCQPLYLKLSWDPVSGRKLISVFAIDRRCPVFSPLSSWSPISNITSLFKAAIMLVLRAKKVPKTEADQELCSFFFCP